MNIDKIRIEFESAIMDGDFFHDATSSAKKAMLERGSNGQYHSVRVSGAWWAWQASTSESRSALASQLVSVLSINRGRPIEWRDAVEITAIITGMDPQEKQRLLDMDEV